MAISNANDPFINRLRLPGDVIITSGSATDNASILIEVGTPGTTAGVGTGSLYIGNSTSTPTIWFGSSEPAEWTSLTLS